VEWSGRIEAGTRIDVPAVTSDILPTVVSWIGAELPPDRHLDGRNLDDIMSGVKTSRHSPIGFESQYQMAWLDDRYKLVFIPRDLNAEARKMARHSQNPATTFEFELYDIVKDPGETKDLATENPEIIRQMSSELISWRNSVADSIKGPRH